MRAAQQLCTWVRSHRWLPWGTGLLLLLFLAYGIAYARLPEAYRYFDLKLRHNELHYLKAGLYPSASLHPPGVILPKGSTIYPPTSLLQIWLVSPFETFPANAQFFVLLNAVAFIIFSRYAWGVGREVAGQKGAWFAMSGMWAMSSTLSCVKSGQYGLLINAMLVMMLAALQSKRPLLAGLAWAGAVIKPHIGLTFFHAFIARRQWWAGATGLALLLVAALGICAYTGVSLPTVLNTSYGQTSTMTFASSGESLINAIIACLGVTHRTAVILSAGVAGMILLPYIILPLARLPLLVHLAAAGVAGRIGFYHLHFDDVMLAFLLLALIEQSLFSRKIADWSATFLVGSTLWIPQVLLVQIPGYSVRLAIWVLGLAYLTRAALQRLNGLTNDAPKVPATAD